MLLSASPVREYLKSADKVTSTNFITVEWNMNRYQQIKDYGIYKGTAGAAPSTYDANDQLIKDGKTVYVYDDNSTRQSEYSEFFSSIASVFEENRPDPGIILTQIVDDQFIALGSDLRASKLKPESPRFYPFSKSRPYDYYNSGKILYTDTLPTGAPIEVSGKSNINGDIVGANIFVVYEDEFPTNKIVIKLQNHQTVPSEYKVEILDPDDNSWNEIYHGVSGANFANGILNLYYDGSTTWTTTETYATNLDEITTPSTELKLIKGIRFKVYSMGSVTQEYVNENKKTVTGKYTGSLELIEISPRIIFDITSYTLSLSVNGSLSEGELGLPVGSIVSSNGNIILSNESKEFLLSSKAAGYRMLTPDVEFKIYQKIYVPSRNETFTIPVKIMYSNSWDITSEFTANIALTDKFKLFQDKKVMDMALTSKQGVPLSVIILMLLDNCGITGYEFKKSSNDDKADKEDIVLKNFWCTKEQTLADVLQDLAVATQSAMYFDAVGKLNVLTKERVTNSAQPAQSWSQTTTGSTDFWMVFDEKYTSQQEQPYISDYVSNVISSTEKRIDPVNDGSIKFHNYGIKRSPGGSLLEDLVPKEFLEDIPVNAIVGSKFVYESRIVWQPGNDNDAVLGAANLVETLQDKHLYADNMFGNETFIAQDEEDAIREIYASAKTSWKNGETKYIENLVISLDQNDIYTFPNYSGFVCIDGEYIEYNGILFSINGSEAKSNILFSKEEFNIKLNELPLRSSIVPKALLVKLRLKTTNKVGNNYHYKIIGDGRAKFNTDITKHYRYKELNDAGITNENKFRVILGEDPKDKYKEYPLTTIDYNFKKGIKGFKEVKRKLGLENSDFKTYLGYLKLKGAKTQQLKSFLAFRASDGVSASTQGVIDKQNQFERQVRNLVPNSSPTTKFDPYLDVESERYIYCQKIDLDFEPDIIGTRMRLFAGRKTTKEKEEIASTYSSIAGIGFGAKFDDSGNFKKGYFVEVESVGSNAKDISGLNKAEKNNLRFYKVEKNEDGLLVPTVLRTRMVTVMTTLSAEANIVNDSSSQLDGVFELEIVIKKPKNNNDGTNSKKVQFDILYGGQSIDPDKLTIDKLGDDQDLWAGKKNIFMFVRGDSQAIFENIYSVGYPKNSKNISRYDNLPKSIYTNRFDKGGISKNQQFIFKDENAKIYFNDFGRTVREARLYKPRFEAPVIHSRLLDISNVNPQYMIKKQNFSTFGGEILVANMSNSVITLTEDSNLPLYLVGYQLEELSSGETTLKDFYDRISDDNKKSTDLAFNRSVYGVKSFTLDNKYIQNKEQADQLCKWILSNCSRERFSFNMTIFPNPLIELGDKIKVFSKDKGYYENNSIFGDKTFVVNDIGYSVNNSGPTMTLNIIEVGAT